MIGRVYLVMMLVTPILVTTGLTITFLVTGLASAAVYPFLGAVISISCLVWLCRKWKKEDLGLPESLGKSDDTAPPKRRGVKRF